MLKAHYDDNGNIILEEGDLATSGIGREIHHALENAISKNINNELLSDADKLEVPCRQTRRVPFMQKAVYQTKLETSAQYVSTAHNVLQNIAEATSDMKDLPRRIHKSLKSLWNNVNKPLVIQRRKTNKPTTKLHMFIVDTVRFGGTFALIFSVLFVSINYQSFFQIARAELALGSDTTTETALQDITGNHRDYDVSNISDDKGASINILAYLPSVGPYEDRLIIPKLGKNVPIVLPKMDALIKKDWKEFENDIQVALRDGVVHYPGSAKPGQAGNFFLTGHSSYYPWDSGSYKDVFALLPQLEIGDTYSVYYGGDKHTYRIIKKYEVKPSDVTVLDQPTSKRIATLMTCTPIGTTLRRLIVRAEEIDPATGEILRVGERTEDSLALPLRRLEALPI